MNGRQLCFVAAGRIVKTGLLAAFAIFMTRQPDQIISRSLSSSSSSESLPSLSSASSEFLSWFENVLMDRQLENPGNDANFTAFVIRDGKLLCRKRHMETMGRGRYLAQMIQKGLEQEQRKASKTTKRGDGLNQNDAHSDYGASSTKNAVIQEEERRNLGDHDFGSDAVYSTVLGEDSPNGFPILLKGTDSNGCNVAGRRDHYDFPRLTWSVPAPCEFDSSERERKYNRTAWGIGEWCGAIGAPSYKSWKDHRKKHKVSEDWDASFQEIEDAYPWDFKIDRAVWRGSTTFNKALWGRSSFDEIPRARLVKKGQENPHLIDAGFHKFVGKFERHRGELTTNKTVVKEAIPFRNMMRYKAIIDIDGNSWSSRFGELLCTNSVVIKILPENVERFYSTDLVPNVHYIPATIENITDAAELATDARNSDKMRRLVQNANDWCRRSLTKRALADEALAALEEYRRALDARYGGKWKEEWGASTLFGTNDTGSAVDDLVECKV